MLTADRTTLWQNRATTIRQLAALRVLAAHRCGLPCCASNETNNRADLDARIRFAEHQVDDMTERLSQRGL